MPRKTIDGFVVSSIFRVIKIEGDILDSLRLLTSIYQKGLGCRLFSVDEIIDYCDMVIDHLENPPIEIIEASLMQNQKTDDIESKLTEYHKMDYDEYIVRVILSIIGQKFIQNDIDLAKAIRCSNRILLHSDFWDEGEYYSLYSMEDAFDLAEDKTYGDIKFVTKQYKEMINEYLPYYDDFIEHNKKVFKNYLS